MSIPAWTRDLDRVLGSALRETPLLATATPVGGAGRAEIVASFESGNPRAPGWTYAPLEQSRASAMAKALESVAREVEVAAEPTSLGRAYAARARELALEALLASEVGAPGFAARARARFPADGGAIASSLAQAWRTEEEPETAADHTSDGSEPTSLASRLREEIGRRRLPFRVLTSAALAPLAATGDRTIWVAEGRRISRTDVERTVLHEIEAHAMPRTRASALQPGLFAIGTAGGVDDQEGLALTLEERHGFLRGARRRELATRHRAVEAMDAGGTFVEVVRTLIERDGATITRAVAAAERAFRGSAGEAAGLGRERVYLASYARVTERLRARPGDERVLGAGQVAVEAIEALEGYVR